jgi:hypothetical protein
MAAKKRKASGGSTRSAKARKKAPAKRSASGGRSAAPKAARTAKKKAASRGRGKPARSTPAAAKKKKTTGGRSGGRGTAATRRGGATIASRRSKQGGATLEPQRRESFAPTRKDELEMPIAVDTRTPIRPASVRPKAWSDRGTVKGSNG